MDHETSRGRDAMPAPVACLAIGLGALAAA